jgi:hypothetical protein
MCSPSWCAVSPQAQSNGNPNTVSQSKPFLFKISLSQEFCCSDWKLTNTAALWSSEAFKQAKWSSVGRAEEEVSVMTGSSDDILVVKVQCVGRVYMSSWQQKFFATKICEAILKDTILVLIFWVQSNKHLLTNSSSSNYGFIWRNSVTVNN